MNLSKYIPYFLIVAAFVFGYLTGPKPDPEVENRFIQERAILQQQIDEKNARIKALTGLGDAFKRKAVQDSIQYAQRLKAKDTRINDLRRKMNEYTTENATILQLDSIAASLYGPTALHQP